MKRRGKPLLYGSLLVVVVLILGTIMISWNGSNYQSNKLQRSPEARPGTISITPTEPWAPTPKQTPHHHQQHHPDTSTTTTKTQSLIPKIIHQSWKSKHKIPARFKPWMQSWRKHNPSHNYIFWEDQDNLDIIQRYFPAYSDLALELSPIALADMARYAMLYKYGGIYADMDFECLGPFDSTHPDLENATAFLGTEPLVHHMEGTHEENVCNAIMGSVANHTFWLDVIEEIQKRFKAGVSIWSPGALTGPDVVRDVYLHKYKGVNAGGSVKVFPPQVFYPEIAYWNEEKFKSKCDVGEQKKKSVRVKEACAWMEKYPKGQYTKDTIAVHHWQCTWCRGEGEGPKMALDSVFRDYITATTLLKGGR